jgi:8-oxo-dGTP diphosphatase
MSEPYSFDDLRFWVAVDTAIFTLCDSDLKTLLVQRDHDPFNGYWGLPGKLCRQDESLEDAAQRQLDEILNIGDVYCQQLYTFGDPNRDPRRRVLSVTYFALVSQDRLPPDGLKDTSGQSAWHSLYHLPKLAFDHEIILNYALTRLRYKIEYSAVAFELMPEEFTLRELQDAYMIILNDHKLDKANFRKKIREANIVEPISRYRETGGRPAKLYRFRKDAQLEVKARRFFP